MEACKERSVALEKDINVSVRVQRRRAPTAGMRRHVVDGAAATRGSAAGADAVHVGIRAPMAMGERLRVGSQRSVARNKVTFKLLKVVQWI